MACVLAVGNAVVGSIRFVKHDSHLFRLPCVRLRIPLERREN